MAMHRYTGPDSTEISGFVVVDLDGAEAADGLLRCAKKVLVDGARTMARSRTYSWALLERRISGASGAVNAAGAERSEGLAGFCEWVRPRIDSGELSLDPGRGVSPAELASLDASDTRPGPWRREHGRGTVADEMLATSAVAAASAALDGLEGCSVAIEGAAPAVGAALIDRLAAAGATVRAVGTSDGVLVDAAGLDPVATADAWVTDGDAVVASSAPDATPADAVTAEVDVVFCGSKLGLVDHHVAAGLSARALVPIGVSPVTAKGLAVAGRGGTTVLADFSVLAGPLLAQRRDDAAVEDLLAEADRTVADLTRRSLADVEGAYLGACRLAEAHLATWVDDLPFGRPLA